ncbi:hypothetical protein RFI_25109 [Reticulomyxa filosa]|uniref:Uncharacterized protein n=1 Tax=Reticulomyxa filosa TaxID=46433 RepID=X6MED1_RETFI|nr:hypothetical protein RFI_25109 [Reticulomyxa filosa]|eukprot:ETO12269.1 hypothetical protein RFI_25109 [Reticulomyxa filosa]
MCSNKDDIETDQHVEKAVKSDQLQIIAYFQPRYPTKENRTEQKEGQTDDKKEEMLVTKENIPETLDFKRHWSVDWIKSNVKAVKMVMEMINKGEQGLVVVAKSIDSNLNILSDNVNSFIMLVSNNKVEKTKIEEYLVYMIKTKLVVFDEVSIDGNVYSIDCEMQSKGNVTITTQVFVTKNVIIDQKLRQSISPIEWNNKIHHDILVELQDLQDKAEQYFDKINFRAAIGCLKEEVQLAIDTFGLNHPYVANAYNNLGAGCVKNERNNDAIQYHKISLKIVLSIFGENHPWIANLYNYLGISYDNLAQFENAITYHKKALDIRLKVFNSSDNWIAYSYGQLGFAYGRKGYYQDQFECYERELKIKTYILGDTHSEIAELYREIGFACKNNEQYDSAIKYFEDSLKIYKKILGKASATIAGMNFTLGQTFGKKGDIQTARKYCEEAWKTYNIAFGGWDTATNHMKTTIQDLDKHTVNSFFE